MAFPLKRKSGPSVGIVIAEKRPDGMGSPSPLGMPKKAPGPQHEAAETPEHEQSEEYGAKLISDIEEAGEKHGMDAEQTHAFAADLFDAVAKCLRGEGGEEQESQSEDQGETDESDDNGTY